MVEQIIPLVIPVAINVAINAFFFWIVLKIFRVEGSLFDSLLIFGISAPFVYFEYIGWLLATFLLCVLIVRRTNAEGLTILFLVLVACGLRWREEIFLLLLKIKDIM